MIESNVSLRPYNTFGIQANARAFGRFSSDEELRTLLEAGSGRPLLVLGGGSNILLTGDLDVLVLKNEIKGIEINQATNGDVYVKSGAGENWHELVRYCVEHGYGGLENLSLIPGMVGASPMQNIGAYGVEIKDVFHQLEALHIETGEVHRFSVDDCAFGYRESVFKNKLKGQYVILRVEYKLSLHPVFHTEYGAIRQELEAMGVKDLSIRAISDAVIRIRSSKLPDPKKVGNAGSFFKNPLVREEKFAELKEEFPSIVAFPAGEMMKLAAGWLIEQCGWKGYREGDAGCYPLQALVLVNYGNASGKEVYELSGRIIDSVRGKFGVELEREVNVY